MASKEQIIESINCLVFGHVEGRKGRMESILKLDRKECIEKYKKEMGGPGGASIENGFCEHDSQGNITIRDYSDNSETIFSAPKVIDFILSSNQQSLF